MNDEPDKTTAAVLRISAMTIDWIRAAVEDVPEARMTAQPGTVVNHPAWTLAHLGAYAGALLAIFDDGSAPTADAEMDLFGYGTTPVADLAAYPTKGELLARLTDRQARLVEVIAEKDADYFPRPAPGRFKGATSTIGDVAVILLTTHTGYHFGQLKQWRRAAGFSEST